MKRKPIKIDWDQLEEAFNEQNEDVPSYLDLVTGHVVLEGEGEEDDYEDPEAFDGHVAAPAPARHDSTRLYVHPPDVATKIEWLKVFVKRVDDLDAEVLGSLEAAADSEHPAQEIREILTQNPDEREAWFLFRAHRLHEMIDNWLEDNGVQAVEPPPWSRKTD